MGTKDQLPAAVQFSTAADAALDGKWAERKADLIFKAGEYDFPPEKGGKFSMTPDEIRAFCAAFKGPVELEDTHAPSIFNGKLGHLTSVEPSADGASFGGKIRVPAWFDGLFRGVPIPLSVNWQRDPANPAKALRLNKVAILPNPRIAGAAMFAAFAAAEAGDAAAADEPDKDKAGKGKKKLYSPHGQKFHQYVHDLAAHHGARCSAEHSPGVKEAPAAEMAALPDNIAADAARALALFHAPHEADSVQKIHDLALGSGAACSLYKSNARAKLRAWSPGNYYAGGGDSMPAYRDYQPGNYALMSDEDALREQKQHTDRERELQARLAAAETARFAAEEDARAAKAKLRQEEVKAAASEAVAFAASFGGRLSPAERQDAVFAYQEASEADRALGGEVHFSDDAGQAARGSRVAALKARMARLTAGRPDMHAHKVPGNAEALFALDQQVKAGGKGDGLEELRKKTRERAEAENRRLREAQAGGRK